MAKIPVCPKLIFIICSIGRLSIAQTPSTYTAPPPAQATSPQPPPYCAPSSTSPYKASITKILLTNSLTRSSTTSTQIIRSQGMRVRSRRGPYWDFWIMRKMGGKEGGGGRRILFRGGFMGGERRSIMGGVVIMIGMCLWRSIQILIPKPTYPTNKMLKIPLPIQSPKPNPLLSIHYHLLAIDNKPKTS